MAKVQQTLSHTTHTRKTYLADFYTRIKRIHTYNTPPQQHTAPSTALSAVIPSSTRVPQRGGVNGPRTKTC
eukprot:1334010-Amorphochlora_amoeboformis.AAC.1